MILSKEFFDQCCPKYQKVIDELEQKIAELKGQADEEVLDEGEISEFSYQIKAAILNFAKNYLTPKEYWDYCIEQISDLKYGKYEEYEKQCYEINAIGYQHFHYDNELNLLCVPGEDDELYLKLLDFGYYDEEGVINTDEIDISYPHNYLTKCFRYFESHASRLPSIQLRNRYEKMKVLYQKIKAAENDVERWFRLLLEAEDDAFVMDNVEYRFGKNLHDVKLWMLYIEYLKQKGHIYELLKVYSNYCRFFLEDFDMLEKYKSETIKYGPVKNLHWPYLFDFELDNDDCEMQNKEDEINGKEDDEDDSMDDECETQNGEKESMDTEDEKIQSDESMDENAKSQNSDILPLDKQVFITFYDTYQFQKFPFKEPLMTYILQNANHRLLRRLFQSCKYFFFKKPTPICNCLEVRRRTKFDIESLALSHSVNPDLYFKNTFITGSIDISCMSVNSETYMSKLIPRLSRCEAKYINLISQNLTFDEFKFLVSHGQVVHYEQFPGSIKDENNEYVDLENIMEYLPNIEKLELPEIKCNANTAHALSNQCFNGKIHKLNILSIFGQPFDPFEFLKFCVKNRDKKILWRMIFDESFNADFVKQFEKIMDDYEGSCKFTEIVVRFD